MWLCTSSGFLSVVADRDNKNNLLVRARVSGHIEVMFPTATVITTENADYLYRASLPRKAVSAAMSKMVQGIDYDNFKNTVQDDALHSAYLAIWRVMSNLQSKLFMKGTADDRWQLG